MQLLIISGNVGKDAELRRTQGGKSVLGFSLAVDNGKDDQGNSRPATWYDCSIWGKRAESLETHITKGTKLILRGRPTAREHDGKAYLGISVDELDFTGGGKREGGNGGYQEQSTNSGYGAGGRGIDDDEVPFCPEVRV